MKKFLLLLSSAAIFVSCNHIYYAPNTVNAPLLKEKNELRINAYYSNGELSSFKGGELQFAFAPTSHFAFMVNGFSASNAEANDYIDDSGQGSYGEVGAGFFAPLGARKDLIFEAYAGVGGGSVNNTYGTSDFSKVNVGKFFMQPSFGYRTRHFEAAFVPRMSLITWKVKDAVIADNDNLYHQEEISHIRSRSSFLNFEPGILVRGGGEHIKAHFGLSLGTAESGNYERSALAESATLSFGVSLILNTTKKPGN